MAGQARIVSFNDVKLQVRRDNDAQKHPESHDRSDANRSSRRENQRIGDYENKVDFSKAQESSSERRRRQRAKARADKMFEKQFADSLSSSGSSSEEGSPRPALYEGKMGSTHRKSARMQRSSSAGPSSIRMNPGAWISGLSVSERSVKVATVFVCIFLVFASLYMPARQYYQAQREHDQLAAEYSIIENRNEALDVQNDILASDAGMEDAVRQKYGYIKEGEQMAVVTGLSDEATNTAKGSDEIEAAVLSSSVKAPEEWYTPLLDAFFGVE